MWAIINKKNNFNIMHTHPNCNLSAAYYVKAPKDSGKFTIENPNSINKHSYPPSDKKTKFNSKLEKLDIEEGDLNRPEMSANLVCTLETAMHRAMQEKQYSAVASNAKVLMKLIGLDTQ